MTIFDALYLSAYPLLPFALRKLGPGLGERLGNVNFERSHRNLVLFHAASVGETNTLKPVLETLQKNRQDTDYAISTITEQGRLNALRFSQKNVVRAPIDFSPIVKRFLKKTCPTLLVLVEQELWPNLILKANCPVALISGRMSLRSYKKYRGVKYLLKPLFSKIALIVVQTEEYRERFINLGANRDSVTVSGSLKFDSLPTIDEKSTRIEMREKLKLGNSFTVLAASTHHPEEEIILNSFKNLKNGARLIIAPRHIWRINQVKELVEAQGYNCYKFSEQIKDNGVILIDTIGELYKLYSACDVAFVGGTFANRGGHNILEPASLGKPIITGPSLYNFSFASKDLENMDALRLVKSQEELTKELIKYYNSPDLIMTGIKGKDYVNRNKGACKVTCDLLTRLFH